MPLVERSPLVQIMTQLVAAMDQEAIPIGLCLDVDRALVGHAEKYRDLAGTNQTQDVKDRARALAVPDHQAKVSLVRHLAILRSIELKAFEILRRIDLARCPMTKIVPEAVAGAKHRHFAVGGIAEVLLHGLIGSVGITNDDLMAAAYDVIEPVFNFGR
ncbi:hypothetical protein BOC56_29360 [Burkholderia pseudomallei]|nr:hypothetical protein BOC56_29360 [Burkholderia pseudomallei]